VHRLVPDACIDLVCTFDRSGEQVTMLLCGPERRAWTFELPAGTTAVGVRYRPGCAAAVHDLDIAPIVDRLVPFHRVIGTDAADGVAEQLLAAGTLDERRAALDVALAPMIARVDTARLDFADRMTDVLVHSPRAAQEHLAHSVGVTPRQLHRRLMRSFGYGSSTLSRILRFQRFLAVRETSDPSSGLAALAAAAGYSDQAHLSRDCRAITGLTVRQFLVEWFPTFPDMSDPFKTSEPIVATIER
jgi:AraC-like DNA-binding protein